MPDDTIKIILIRKGFDSAAGGIPSPILDDGTMLSLPIRSRYCPIRYRDIEATAHKAQAVSNQHHGTMYAVPSDWPPAEGR